MIGRTIDDTYKIDDEVGSGGFSTVYRARNLRTDEVVAVKVMHARLAGDPRQVERFHRETQAAQTVDSPYVVKVLHHGEVDGRPYLVMEYLHGNTLAEFIQESGSLPAEEAVRIVRQLGQALDAIQSVGLVHRDVKPQNIMITEDGSAKLMDLGVVKSTFMSTITQTGVFVGTPHYMSPEQVEGQHTDIRSDIYALGIVLYQMLAGQVPFDADSPWAVMRKHLEAPPPMRPVQRPDVPAWLIRILVRMLAKHPAQRFQSPGELLNALKSEADETILASAHRSHHTPATTMQGLPSWIPFAGIGAVLLIAFGATLLANNPIPPLLPIPTNTPTPTPTFTITPTITPSPTNTHTPTAVPTFTSTPTPGPTPLYRSGLITFLRQGETGKTLYAVGPDGTPIALVKEVADLMILSVSPDQRYLAIATSEAGEISRSTIYPRFMEGPAVNVLVVSADGRKSTIVVGGVSQANASYAPGGRLIIAVLKGSTVTYTVSQTDGSEPRELYRSENVFARPTRTHTPQPPPAEAPTPAPTNMPPPTDTPLPIRETEEP